MDNFIRSVKSRAEAKARNAELYQDEINTRVSTSVLKRYKTVFIGNMDSVDKIIGVLLWGYGKDYEDLTPHERSWLIKREEVRKAILDNGNKEMRAAEDELEQYDFVPNE